MPELPEVHALAEELTRRMAGGRLLRLELASFTALKTFDPPVAAREGAQLRQVGRHGKHLDFRFAPRE